MRLFIASSLTPVIHRKIETFLGDIKLTYGSKYVRWVNPAGIHLTYKFLGDTPEVEIPSISKTLDEIGALVTPFSIAIKGLGCFPNCSRPRVIWVGVKDESGSLLKMQTNIERGLVKLGFAEERRKFHPHLTLGRLRRGAEKSEIMHLGETLRNVSQPNLGNQEVSRIELVQSDLRPSGAIYTRLHSSELSGGTEWRE